jgi:hypothetical protein
MAKREKYPKILFVRIFQENINKSDVIYLFTIGQVVLIKFGIVQHGKCYSFRFVFLQSWKFYHLFYSFTFSGHVIPGEIGGQAGMDRDYFSQASDFEFPDIFEAGPNDSMLLG